MPSDKVRVICALFRNGEWEEFDETFEASEIVRVGDCILPRCLFDEVIGALVITEDDGLDQAHLPTTETATGCTCGAGARNGICFKCGEMIDGYIPPPRTRKKSTFLKCEKSKTAPDQVAGKPHELAQKKGYLSMR